MYRFLFIRNLLAVIGLAQRRRWLLTALGSSGRPPNFVWWLRLGFSHPYGSNAGKDKGNDDSYGAFLRETSLRRSGIARMFKGYHSFTCTPCVSSASRMSYAFPAAAGTHLPTPEGWQAEYTLVKSSPCRDSNLQPAEYKSGTLPHSH